MTDTWSVQANCASIGEAFFSPDNERHQDRQQREATAKRICHNCPVRTECLNVAIAQDIREGIWGGLTERERRKLREEAVA